MPIHSRRRSGTPSLWVNRGLTTVIVLKPDLAGRIRLIASKHDANPNKCRPRDVGRGRRCSSGGVEKRETPTTIATGMRNDSWTAHDFKGRVSRSLHMDDSRSAEISFGVGSLAGIAFREAWSAGNASREGRSAGIAFREGESVGIAFREPRQTENQQIHPLQTEFRQNNPRQTEFQQSGPRQTQKRQKPGGWPMNKRAALLRPRQGREGLWDRQEGRKSPLVKRTSR